MSSADVCALNAYSCTLIHDTIARITPPPPAEPAPVPNMNLYAEYTNSSASLRGLLQGVNDATTANASKAAITNGVQRFNTANVTWHTPT
jgi:hypothetical protein